MTVTENPDGTLLVTPTPRERATLLESELGTTPGDAVQALLRSLLATVESRRRRKLLAELRDDLPDIPTDELRDFVRKPRRAEPATDLDFEVESPRPKG
jgi:hypothetical protein